MDSEGASRPLISYENSVVHHLSALRLRTTRLYLVLEDPAGDEAKLQVVREEVAAWAR